MVVSPSHIISLESQFQDDGTMHATRDVTVTSLVLLFVVGPLL